MAHLAAPAYLQETPRNLTNEDGLTFLHIACTRPHVQIVRAILQNDQIDVNHTVSQRSTSGFRGYSPLHFAVQYGQYQVAEVLLRQNADIYIQDHNKSTPLHLALEQRNVEMIDLLLTYDHRHENVTNKWGLSHLMAACVGTDAKIVDKYIKVAREANNVHINNTVNDGHVFAGYNPLRFAIEYDRSTTAQMLRDYGAAFINWLRSKLLPSSPEP